MKRTFMLVAAALALGLTLGAAPAFAKPDCGENTGQKATGKPIPIGGVTSMSGIGSFKEADDAARAYFDCVNANGGIHGRPITYHDEDDQSQLDVAAQAAKKLVEDEGVYLMIGSTSFIECIPNANYYLKNNILEIGLGIPRNAISRRTSPRSMPDRGKAASAAPILRGASSAPRRWSARFRNSPAPTIAATDWRNGARSTASR